MLIPVGTMLHRRIGLCFNILLWITALAFLGAAARQLWPSHRDLLTQRIAHVDFRGTPLKEALAQLGAAVGAKVVIHQAELEPEAVTLSSFGFKAQGESAAVTLSKPVDLKLHDVTLQAAFDRLVAGRLEGCLLEQRGKVLHVTAAKSSPSVVRIYDIGDLVARAAQSDWPDHADWTSNLTSSQQQNPQPGGGITGAQIHGSASSQSRESDAMEQLDKIDRRYHHARDLGRRRRNRD